MGYFFLNYKRSY